MKYLALLLLLVSTHVLAKPHLRDIGVVGLMSHDIFAWDSKAEVNTENGRLDLSTIFDYDGGSRWKKGGNPKNAENSPVYTITMQLVDHYKSELKTLTPFEARKSTVALFHKMIKESFERLSGLRFPSEGKDEMVTNTEQAALRAMHDILPGRAKLYGRAFRKDFKLTNVLNAKLKLNEKELNQELKDFNGDYDEEYKNIKIPFTKVVINLKEVDRKFIEKFSPYKQADMLAELAMAGRGDIRTSDVSFMHHIHDLVSKAICPKGKPVMPQEVVCY